MPGTLEADRACQQAWLSYAKGDFVSADRVFETALHTHFSLTILADWAKSLRFRGRLSHAVALFEQGWNHARRMRRSLPETLFCLELAACNRLMEDIIGHRQFVQLAWRSHFHRIENGATENEITADDAIPPQLSLEQAFVCTHSGNHREALNWVDRFKEARASDNESQPEVLRVRASFEWQSGSGRSAISSLQESCQQSLMHGDFHSNILNGKLGSNWALQLEDQRAGIDFLKNALHSANTIHDRDSAVELQGWIGRLNRAQRLLSSNAILN
ncbi:hypothetical protein [Planctomicrobium sp. SH527]|uniref:hypothetical protein n=1 Tax=Planctomicrobium sp. SH527 TaxID=3448123 RepID=UPI003F5B107E